MIWANVLYLVPTNKYLFFSLMKFNGCIIMFQMDKIFVFNSKCFVTKMLVKARSISKYFAQYTAIMGLGPSGNPEHQN